MAVNQTLLEEGASLHLQFEKRGGMLPVIVQDHHTLGVLMLGYTNELAFNRSLETGLATFWSTSRNALWTKGESSGDFLELVEIRIDCDQDALLYLVTPKGEGVCHTKSQEGLSRTTCFYRKIKGQKEKKIQHLPNLE